MKWRHPDGIEDEGRPKFGTNLRLITNAQGALVMKKNQAKPLGLHRDPDVVDPRTAKFENNEAARSRLGNYDLTSEAQGRDGDESLKRGHTIHAAGAHGSRDPKRQRVVSETIPPTSRVTPTNQSTMRGYGAAGQSSPPTASCRSHNAPPTDKIELPCLHDDVLQEMLSKTHHSPPQASTQQQPPSPAPVTVNRSPAHDDSPFNLDHLPMYTGFIPR